MEDAFSGETYPVYKNHVKSHNKILFKDEIKFMNKKIWCFRSRGST